MRASIAVALALATCLPFALGSDTRAQSHIWSQRFGDTDRDVVEDVAIDPSANIVVVGHFGGNVNFGGGTLSSAGGWDIFLASYDENGTHNWSQHFGDTSNDEGYAIAVDSEGNVAITGYYRGSVDFGGGDLVNDESENIFVAKFDIAGNHLWSLGYAGGTDADEGLSIAFDPDENVVVTGCFGGTVDLGGGPLTAQGTNDIFLLKLDADGNHAWSHAFGDSVSLFGEVGRGVAADGDGNIAIIGWFDSTIDFGGGALVTAGLQEVYLAKLAPDGSHLWSHRFGSTLNDVGKTVAFDTGGAVVAAGLFSGTVDFGGGPLVAGSPTPDIFLLKYSSGGSHVWSQQMGGTAFDDPYDIAIDEDDNSIMMTGTFTETADFGGGPLVEVGTQLLGDIFVASYTTNGAHRWSSAFGDTLVDIGAAVAVAPGNDVVIGGAFSADVDFGGGVHTSAGDYDAFLVKIEGPQPSAIENRPPPTFGNLRQNVPNPFGPSTEIRFTLDDAADMSLVIYDVAGRHVVTILSERLPAGGHARVWNGRDASGHRAPSGVYFYRLSAGTNTLTRKAILLR